MRIIGIDVGLSGGVAIVSDAGWAEVFDLPVSGDGPSARINAAALKDLLMGENAAAQTHAFVENANAHPDQGVSSVFRYGRAVGAIEAAVACAGVPITLVAPQTWKKFFHLKGPNKERSRHLAIQRFPAVASSLSRKKDHGRAEALLIASYGLTYMSTQQQRAA